MSMQAFPMNRAFTLLESGPVILVGTRENGKDNLMTITWHMVMSFTPQIALSTGPWNHSFDVMMKTRACTICIPGVDLIEKVIGVGTVSGTEYDKFERFGFTALPAKEVDAPLVAECLACLECEVCDYIEDHGIVVLDVMRAWANPDREEKRTFHAVGDGTFIVDGTHLDYHELMANKLPF
jgi:flavin reductase (DIM6/NTAB) family NADH-FMN oxidoreductase RutF